MRGYQYIIDLFQAILDESKAIEGRFYLGHKYGLQDVNYDNIGQTLDKITGPKKYPLVLMAPPHSAEKKGWDDYRITLFFMKQSFKEEILISTKTSAHGIPQDWHDMKRVARDFFTQLEYVNISNTNYIYKHDHNTLYIPLSQIGADRISGVRTDFDFKLFDGCELEDYDELLNNIIISDDGHPQHTL